MKVLEIFSLIIILSPIGQVFGAQASGGHHKRARVEQVGSIQKKRARISDPKHYATFLYSSTTGQLIITKPIVFPTEGHIGSTDIWSFSNKPLIKLYNASTADGWRQDKQKEIQIAKKYSSYKASSYLRATSVIKSTFGVLPEGYKLRHFETIAYQFMIPDFTVSNDPVIITLGFMTIAGRLSTKIATIKIPKSLSTSQLIPVTELSRLPEDVRLKLSYFFRSLIHIHSVMVFYKDLGTKSFATGKGGATLEKTTYKLYNELWLFVQRLWKTKKILASSGDPKIWLAARSVEIKKFVQDISAKYHLDSRVLIDKINQYEKCVSLI